MASVDNDILLAGAMKAAAIGIAANGNYDTPQDIARWAIEILEEWDKVLMNRPHMTRQRDRQRRWW